MLYFFLSYARGDDDVSVQKFFNDLSAEVRAYAGLAAGEEVGFFDVHSLEVGATWSPRLVEALSECQSFIALVSPRYLVSEPCGREWTIFADRLRRYEREVGVRPPVLMPLLWLPPQRLPEAVAELQYHNDVLPEAYARNGLRQLMRLQRHQDSYYELIVELARQIVRTAAAHRLPRASPGIDFREVPSTFHAQVSASVQPREIQAQQVQRVQFVVAAPARGELTSDDLGAVDRDSRYYGATSLEWAPYRPTLPVPIADYARTVAERRSFRAEVSGTAGLAQRIGDARRANQIVVLLVDVWSTMLREYRQALAEANQLDQNPEEPVTAIMVPLNHDDRQAQVHRRQLTDSLRAIFFRRTVHGDDVMFRSSILTHQAFEADLEVVLEAARNRVFATGTVYNRPPGQTVRRPILHGPGGYASPVPVRTARVFETPVGRVLRYDVGDTDFVLVDSNEGSHVVSWTGTATAAAFARLCMRLSERSSEAYVTVVLGGKRVAGQLSSVRDTVAGVADGSVAGGCDFVRFDLPQIDLAYHRMPRQARTPAQVVLSAVSIGPFGVDVVDVVRETATAPVVACVLEVAPIDPHVLPGRPATHAR